MQRDHDRGGTTMTATTEISNATGNAQVLATYDCDEGRRQLVGQRVDGTVRITDRNPAGGRAYLVDEGFQSMAELEALVADYLAKAARIGYAPMQGWF